MEKHLDKRRYCSHDYTAMLRFRVRFIVLVTIVYITTSLPELICDYSGCTINYYDENFQLIQNLNSANQTNFNPGQWPASSGQYNNNNNLTSISSNGNLTNSYLIGFECQNITTDQLHDHFNRVKPFHIISLMVKDSNLSSLSNLPQGTHELKRLTLSNTSMDLEVLKEGSESLKQLNYLEISNEKISNIPQNFFQEMQSLRELRLENDGIASLDSDAFHNLDDSLEILGLRNNRFNRFPMAVKNLAQLTVLDLSDNDLVIDTQDSDLPEKLELLLNLRELIINRINCTCDFSSSPFFEWIVKTHIYGVRCFAPEKLKSQEVIVFERDEFCSRSSNMAKSLAPSYRVVSATICCYLGFVFHNKLININNHNKNGLSY